MTEKSVALTKMKVIEDVFLLKKNEIGGNFQRKARRMLRYDDSPPLTLFFLNWATANKLNKSTIGMSFISEWKQVEMDSLAAAAD